MASSKSSEQRLKRFLPLCSGIPFSKLLADGAAYGAEANIYRPATIADMELSSPQCLLLTLLHSLVKENTIFSVLLADICYRVEKLHSRYYRLWILEDFAFPQLDIYKAIAFLVKQVSAGTLKLPPHVMGIMTSLAYKYGIKDIQLRTLSEEGLDDLADQLENAVSNNSPRDIIGLVSEGGNVNGSTRSGDSLLHLAARAGNCASIAALNFLKADLEAVNSRNFTPLVEAVKNCQVSAVKALISAGANLEKRFYRGDTYLHIAAAEGSVGALEVLLEKGMNVNEKNHFDETPLINAIRAGSVKSVEVLLSKGADSSIILEGGKCVSELVLESQNPDMFKAFIINGKDLKTNDGDTILHLVARSGNAKMLEVIKNLKVPKNINNQNGLTPLHVASDPSIVRMLVRMGINVNTKTQKGETALHFASAKGSLELVKALVRLGADVDSQDDEGITALMISSANSMENIVTFLLFNGANPNIRDKGGRMPLHFAAEGGCVGSVTALLDAGVKTNDQDDKGDTPAMIAALNNKPDVLKLLIKSWADLTLRDSNGDGIIHSIASSGCTEVLTALLDLQSEVDMKGQDERTALHVAARHGHPAMVAVLLDRGADMESKDVEGYTPLMLASNQGHLSVVQLLIDRGSAINERDKNGKTALHWANVNKQKARVVADYLRSKGAI